MNKVTIKSLDCKPKVNEVKGGCLYRNKNPHHNGVWIAAYLPEITLINLRSGCRYSDPEEHDPRDWIEITDPVLLEPEKKVEK